MIYQEIRISGKSKVHLMYLMGLIFKVNDNNLFFNFPVKDPYLTKELQVKGQMENVVYEAISNEEKYTMEFTFPWETREAKPKMKNLDSIFCSGWKKYAP